jgi:hypothetical protein
MMPGEKETEGAKEATPKKTTVILIARPSMDIPYVVYSDLMKGIYSECGLYSLKTILRFTDVGLAAWKAAQAMDKAARIELRKASWLEEDKQWLVMMFFNRTRLELECRRYRNFGEMSEAFYQKLRFRGQTDEAHEFSKVFVQELGRRPYLLLNWDDLERETGHRRDDILLAWKGYLDEDLPSEDRLVFDLYASIKDKGPFLSYADLFKGNYVEASPMGLATIINFTDIGAAVYKVAKEMDPDASIRLLKTSALEEDRSWTVQIDVGDNQITLQSIRYKTLGDQLKAFYMKISYRGDELGFGTFMELFAQTLGRHPLDGLDWEALESKLGITSDSLQGAMPFTEKMKE